MFLALFPFFVKVKKKVREMFQAPSILRVAFKFLTFSDALSVRCSLFHLGTRHFSCMQKMGGLDRNSNLQLTKISKSHKAGVLKKIILMGLRKII